MPKKKVKLTLAIDAELANEAQERGEDLALLLETALLRRRRAQKWLEENREAIASSNAQLEKEGMWYVPDWLR